MKRPRLPEYLVGLGALLALWLSVEAVMIYSMFGYLETVYIVFLASLVPFMGALVVTGVWLRRGNMPARRFRRIGGWTAGGLLFFGGVFFIVGGLTMSLEELIGAARWGAGVGAGIGAITGAFEARAIETARHAERQRTRKRELEKRTDRLEEFARIISHDLRNPLTIAMGHLDLERADQDSEHLAAINQSLERIEVILTGTLDLAKNGQVINDPEPIALDALARSAWANVETLDATVDIEGTMTVNGDPGRLGNVFENLYRNAMEHGPEDVSIRVGPLPGGTGFFVEDDGPGVPEKHRENVFEPGESTKSDGTGFGLTIVRSIVAAHDWEITLTDGESGGARFEIEFEQSERPIAGELDADPDLITVQ